jgi:hypothetical protein
MRHPDVQADEALGHVSHVTFAQILMKREFQHVFTQEPCMRGHLSPTGLDAVVPELERVNAAPCEPVDNGALIRDQNRKEQGTHTCGRLRERPADPTAELPGQGLVVGDPTLANTLQVDAIDQP